MRYDYSDLKNLEDAIPAKRYYSRMRIAHFQANVLRNKLPLPGGVSVSRFISKVLLPPLKGPLICHTNLGFDLIASKEDGLIYYYDGQYEPGTLHVMAKCLRHNDVFIDVGASVGQMSFFASNLVGESGKIISFEPHTERFKGLINGIKLNKMKNIIAYNTGLGRVEKDLKLYTDRVSPSLISKGEDSDFENIRILKLDSVLEKEKIKNVRMVKIDVEGFELEVLKGSSKLLSSDKAPIICMEYEEIGNKPLENLQFLKDINDYVFFNLEKTKGRASKLRKVNAIEEVRLHDNVFCLLEKDVKKMSSNKLFAVA